MMREAGIAHIVIEIEAQALRKTLWRVFPAFIGEAFGALAQIGVEYALIARQPLTGYLLGLTLGHRLNIGSEQTEELVKVCQRVARQRSRSGHRLLRTDAVRLEY